MDDDKVLTLLSNNKIFLNQIMRLCFKISNHRNATHAIVSRVSVLFINESYLDLISFKNSWLKHS